MSENFSAASDILTENYNFMLENDLLSNADLTLTFSTLAFAHWYNNEFINAIELLALYIISCYKVNKRPMISLIEKDGMSDTIDYLDFFSKDVFIFIIPSGKTYSDFNNWTKIVVEKKPNLKEILSEFVYFRRDDDDKVSN